MPRTSTSMVTYTCDQCGKEETIDPMNTPYPKGWRGFYPPTPEDDMFCGWECVAIYAVKQDRAQKAAETAAEKDVDLEDLKSA